MEDPVQYEKEYVKESQPAYYDDGIEIIELKKGGENGERKEPN